MLEWVKFFASLIVPPTGEGPVERYRWQAGMATLMGGVILIIGAHIAWACGFLINIGLTGFANAQDVSAVKAEVESVHKENRNIEASIEDGKIMTDRERQCRLPASNVDARELMALRLEAEMNRYHHLTGENYLLPDCSEF